MNKPQVNHKDLNKKNNCLYNLEWATNRENATHARSQGEYTSKYIGVSWDIKSQKWFSGIQIGGRRKHLGSFSNEMEAHITYQKALQELLDNGGR